jgi:hypothetical protein
MAEKAQPWPSVTEPFLDASAAMNQRSENIEALAKMAARLAGRDPDEHVRLAFGEVTAFDGPVWRYPDFLVRAETAYEALSRPTLVRPEELIGRDVSIQCDGMPVAEVNGRRLGPNKPNDVVRIRKSATSR